MNNIYDVIIVGAGAAGLAAAIYTGRAKLDTLLLEREVIGGELMNRELIENYPGFPEGILGPELGSQMATQAMNCGAEIELCMVEGIGVEGNYRTVRTTEEEYLAKGVIIAGGARTRRLGVPGEADLAEKGVIYCATCEGPQFGGKVVSVVGGGDSGVTEALFLARIAKKVILVTDYLLASKTLQERLLSNPKVEVRVGFTIAAIHGQEHVEAVDLISLDKEQKGTIDCDGVLVRVGLEPNTAYLRDSVPLSGRGQVLVDLAMGSEVPGIFAAGDIRHNSPMQFGTAVGDGITAALSLERYLVHSR
ncbi:MAG: FAD-dependent oxidoreductase [Chloroflexi bacterium]|nr:FAD-dependent oxidoreductase [Chloroflexota bacterium]